MLWALDLKHLTVKKKKKQIKFVRRPISSQHCIFHVAQGPSCHQPYNNTVSHEMLHYWEAFVLWAE